MLFRSAIAGIDMSVTNKGGATTWTLDTTVSGVDLTLTSAQKITAAFGLAGNTMTVKIGRASCRERV